MTESGDKTLAYLNAKSALRRWKALAVAGLVLLVVVMVESSGGFSKGGGVKGDYIARITVSDFVYDDWDLQKILTDIEADDAAKALIVWIDTPGGNAVGGEEVYHRLRLIAKKKPTVAVMRSMATSAGYMIAIGTDHIVARESTITGSIGVLIQSAEVTKLAERLGITPITVKSSPLKGSPSLFEEASPEAIASLQTLIDSFYHSFVAMVADRRPFNLKTAYELADGRVYSGKQALKLQLIDEIGGEDEAIKWLKDIKKVDDSLDVVDMDRKPKGLQWLDDMAETISRKLFIYSRSPLDGLSAIWHPSL